MKAVVFSKGTSKIRNLDKFLRTDSVVYARSEMSCPDNVDLVVGWGRKASSKKAHSYATKNRIPFCCIEDGFVRSVGLGVDGAAPLSVVVDDVGIYYDATAPSLLEDILNGLRTVGCSLDDVSLINRASSCIDSILSKSISKYNNAQNAGELDRLVDSSTVLVLDQTRGDCSVEYGMADENSFRLMLDSAIAENPGCKVAVKIHPDVVCGKKTGYLSELVKDNRYGESVCLIDVDVNPIALLKSVGRVYTVTSQMGFEALMCKKRVACFGVPFYAGWGLTDDRISCARRSRERSLEQVFAAAYLLYARYINPVTGANSNLEDTIELISKNMSIVRQEVDNLYCFGFSRWKRGYVRKYLGTVSKKIIFCSRVTNKIASRVSSNDGVAIWGRRDAVGIDNLVAKHGVSVFRVEDGFVRSIGLGSNFVRPFSMVVDSSGIYFDSMRESDLEKILCNEEFSEADLDRGKKIIDAILAGRLTKYNMPSTRQVLIPDNVRSRVLLVVGQVEDDASIACGAGDVRKNLDLLKLVRRNNPDAYIVYKPHPDVEYGNRIGFVPDGVLLNYCNFVARDSSVVDCICASDQVHTMTSLAGFEALIRGKSVFVYGSPFYSGWGLTVDSSKVERRGRMLSLYELAFAVYAKYPLYFDWDSGYFCECEDIVEKLSARIRSGSREAGGSFVGRVMNKYGLLIGGYLRG